MKMYLTSILLCAAIILMVLGVHTNNFNLVGIGGVLAGAYNTMIYQKD